MSYLLAPLRAFLSLAALALCGCSPTSHPIDEPAAVVTETGLALVVIGPATPPYTFEGDPGQGRAPDLDARDFKFEGAGCMGGCVGECWTSRDLPIVEGDDGTRTVGGPIEEPLRELEPPR